MTAAASRPEVRVSKACPLLMLLLLTVSIDRIECQAPVAEAPALVEIPKLIPYFSEDTSPSLLQQLFATQNNFTLNATSEWTFDGAELNDLERNLSLFDQGAIRCAKSMVQTPSLSPDYCLFQVSTDSLKALNTALGSFQPSQTGPILTSSWFSLRPVLLSRCANVTNCSSHETFASPSYVKTTYFFRVFASSVWSLIFLYIVTSGSLFFVFERTKPRDMYLAKYDSQHRVKPPEIYGAMMFALYPVFLHGHHRKIRAWASKVLLIFWLAFCIICLIAYAAGSYRLLFESVEHIEGRQIERAPIIDSSTQFVCQTSSLWCNKLASQFNMTPVTVFSNESNVLLVNQAEAQQFKVEQKDHRDWVESRVRCDAEKIGMGRGMWPSVKLAFVAKNKLLSMKMNIYLQSVNEAGLFDRMQTTWDRHSFNVKHGLCLSTAAETNSRPNDQHFQPIAMATFNGPLVFMIIGVLLAIVTHILEFIYFVCIQTKPVIDESTQSIL